MRCSRAMAATAPPRASCYRKKCARRGVFDGLDVLRAPLTGWRDGIKAAEAGHKSARAPEGRAAAWTWPTGCRMICCLKLDRCLMAHAVEGRTPFIDKPNRRLRLLAAGQAARSATARANICSAAGWRKTCPRRGLSPKNKALTCRSAPGSPRRPSPWPSCSSRQPIIAELAEPEKVHALLANAAHKQRRFRRLGAVIHRPLAPPPYFNLPPAGDVFATLRQI